MREGKDLRGERRRDWEKEEEGVGAVGFGDCWSRVERVS